MVRKARVWFDGELTWNPAEAEEAGGIAVQTQTAELHTLRAGETLPEFLTSKEEEAEAVPVENPSPKRAGKERRHLAGANWLDDWTCYLPAKTKPRRTKKQK